MEGSSASRNVETMPSWEVPPPYKGRSAHCVPMLLDRQMAPLTLTSPTSSNTSVRPSISHLITQDRPFLQAVSDLSTASHHTSTKSHASPAVSQAGHVHNKLGAEPGHRAQTHQIKQSYGGLAAQFEPVADHPMTPRFGTQPARYSSSAEAFTPTYGALHNESMPYHTPLTPEQHPHALALHQKKQPVLNQQNPTMKPVSSSAIAAVSGRYKFNPAAPEFFSSKIHSQPSQLEQRMRSSFKSKPQQPVPSTFMHDISLKPALTILKEPALFAQSADPPQQQQQDDSDKPSMAMGAAVQLKPTTSTTTASAGQKNEESMDDKSPIPVALADAPNKLSQDDAINSITMGGFRGIQEIAASMTKLLPSVTYSDDDCENLMICLVRIQELASITHHLAKQVCQQAEGQGEDGTHADLVGVQQQLGNAEQQLEFVQQQLAAAEAEVQRQGQQLRNSTADRNRLQVALTSAQQAAIQTQNSNAELDALRQQLATSQQSLCDSEARATQETERANNAEAEVSRLGQEVYTRSSEGRGWQQELQQAQQDLTAALEQIRSSQDRISDLEFRAANAEASAAERLNSSEESTKAAERQLEDYKQRLKSAEASAEISRQQLEEVQGLLDVAATAAQELALVKQQVAGVSSRERDEQVAGTCQAEQETQQLRTALLEQQEEAKKLNGEARKAEKEVEDMAQDVKILFNDCIKAGDQKAELEEEVKGLKQALADQKRITEEVQLSESAQGTTSS